MSTMLESKRDQLCLAPFSGAILSALAVGTVKGGGGAEGSRVPALKALVEGILLLELEREAEAESRLEAALAEFDRMGGRLKKKNEHVAAYASYELGCLLVRRPERKEAGTDFLEKAKVGGRARLAFIPCPDPPSAHHRLPILESVQGLRFRKQTQRPHTGSSPPDACFLSLNDQSITTLRTNQPESTVFRGYVCTVALLPRRCVLYGLHCILVLYRSACVPLCSLHSLGLCSLFQFFVYIVSILHCYVRTSVVDSVSSIGFELL